MHSDRSQRRSPLFSLLLIALPLLAISCGTAEDDGMNTESFRMSLNGVWDFRVDSTGVGVDEQWYAPDRDRAAWDTMRVPGRWDMMSELASYDGYGWYARRFDMEIEEGKTYAIVFDAVDDNADIWLNGVRIGSHVGYGELFYFDVTPQLREEGNVIAVRIEDIAGPGGMIGNVALLEYEEEIELLRSAFYDMQSVESPAWVREAVLYEVYLRSFSKEGSFRALQRRLPELKQLGVTVLWLMPIHPVGEKRRKGSLGSPYAVKDYYAVNPEFGTLEDFRALVDAVHDEGMHIIIDLVANHTAWDNPLIEEHPEWYTRGADGEIIAPNANWHDVADLDYSNDSLRAWMKEMMLYWVRDVGIDGYRCDVAELVPHEFWVDAAQALREVRPVMMLAEGADPELHIDAFDLTYAWNSYDVLRPIIEGEAGVEDIATTLTRESYRYPKGALRLRFTTNHDKSKYDGPAVEWFGPEGAKASAVLVTLLPGVPLVYNGQEVGNDRRLSLFEKVTIDWESDRHGFREFYRRLLNARAAHPALRRGDMRLLPFDSTGRVFAFVREYEQPAGKEKLLEQQKQGAHDAANGGMSEAVVVIVNMSDQKAAGRLDLTPAVKGQPLLIAGEAELDREGVSFNLPPFGYLVLY